MRELKALHTIGAGPDTENVTIVDVLLKANDDLYVVYVDPERRIDGDEPDKFLVTEGTST